MKQKIIPEFVILIIFPLIYYLGTIIYLISNYRLDLIEFLFYSNTNLKILTGNYMFLFVFLFFVFFLGIRAVLIAVKGRNYSGFNEIINFGIFFVFSAFAHILLASSLIIVYLLISDESVLYATELVDSWEISVFQSLPSVWLVNIFYGSIWEKIILIIYRNLVLIVPSIILIQSFLSVLNFRRAVLSYFLVFVISIPIWVLVPTLSPHEIYLEKRIDVSSFSTADEMGYREFSPFLLKNLSELKEMWIKKYLYTISNFPSAHLAWALVFSYYLYKTRRFFLPVSVVVTVGTFLGTIYSQQHYALDSFAGILLAILVIIVINNFVKADKGGDGINSRLYGFCEPFQEFRKKAVAKLFLSSQK